MEIRNIAIIAHVDHGKTTLVDKMIEAGQVVNERDRMTGELIMDNNDLERERGITIVSILQRHQNQHHRHPGSRRLRW
jgi:GTP-binding protein